MPNNWRVGVVAVIVASMLDFCANWLAAHVLLSVGSFLIPGGTLVFALAFTVYDYIRRQFGFGFTVSAVLLGFLVSVAYSALFGGGVGRIAVAGLIALVFSSTMDLFMQTVTLRWPIWQYVGTSNAVSLAIDSIVFTTIAFAALPLDVRLHILEGQYLAKLAMTLVSIPLVYWARASVAREGDVAWT